MPTTPDNNEAEIIPFVQPNNNEESPVPDTETQDRGITLTFSPDAQAQFDALSDPEKAPYGVPGHAGRLRQKIEQGTYDALISRSSEVPLTTAAGDVRSIVRKGVTFLFTIKVPTAKAKDQNAKVNVVSVFFQVSSTPHGSPNHSHPIGQNFANDGAFDPDDED